VLSIALEPDSQIAGEPSKDVTEFCKLGHPQRRKDEASKRSPHPSAPLPAIVAATDSLSQSENSDRQRDNLILRKSASPLAVSFVIHAVALLLCVTFTFATIVQQGIPLFASPTDLDEETVADIDEVEIKPTKFDDAELQNVISENEEFFRVRCRRWSQRLLLTKSDLLSGCRMPSPRRVRIAN